jgi:hypothetical protein
MERTGDPGQIMSNFVKDMETSSGFTGILPIPIGLQGHYIVAKRAPKKKLDMA